MYTDDRLLEEYNGKVQSSMNDSFTRSQIAIYWAVMLLVGLGYFLNISKSVLSPTLVLTFLGMIVDSIQCSSFITEKHRDKEYKGLSSKTQYSFVDINSKICWLVHFYGISNSSSQTVHSGL